MNELRRLQGARGRLSPSRVDGDVLATAQIEGDDGIAYSLFEWHVSGYNRDGSHVHERVADGEDECNRII
jgi:hypothetical protein